MRTETVVRLLINKKNIFLLGPGGVGKTYVIQQVAFALIKLGKKVSCTALTGIAAINLNARDPDSSIYISGSTLHRWAGIGLGQLPAERLAGNILRDIYAKNRWRNTDVLIIDEISMFGRELFEKLDTISKIVRGNELPFGGLALLLSGDFMQLKPVKDAFIFKSEKWDELEAIHIPLTEPKRYPDIDWFERLLRFRKCTHNKSDIDFLYSRLAAYEEYIKNQEKYRIKPTILYSRKVDVESYNLYELNKLESPEKTFVAFDTFKALHPKANKEFYKKMFDEVIPESIVLKVGAQVMLKANLSVETGLVNGSRGVVTKIVDGSGAYVEWMNKRATFVPCHVWEHENDDCITSRSQIPLVLAWALTIHKIQGCEVDCAIVDLGSSIFEDGQAYVAMSRVKRSDGLYVSNILPESLRADRDALEYVKMVQESVGELDFVYDNDTDQKDGENKDTPVIDQ